MKLGPPFKTFRVSKGFGPEVNSIARFATYIVSNIVSNRVSDIINKLIDEVQLRREIGLTFLGGKIMKNFHVALIDINSPEVGEQFGVSGCLSVNKVGTEVWCYLSEVFLPGDNTDFTEGNVILAIGAKVPEYMLEAIRFELENEHTGYLTPVLDVFLEKLVSLQAHHEFQPPAEGRALGKRLYF